MSNSKLADIEILSPNWSYRKGNKIRKITIHHAAAVTSVEALGMSFAKRERAGSSNYGLGNDGRIGLYVPESKAAWTSGSQENDRQAITIEVSNSAIGGDYPISDEAWDSMIALCVDICQRNKISELVFTGDATGNLTMHRYFQATACPGEYLASRFGEISEIVNATLRGEAPMTREERKEFDALKATVESLQETNGIRWNYIDGNLPTWAKPTVQKLYERGVLVGNEKGELQLSYQFLRELVILDRSGAFDASI